jgi:NADH:ubiquinone oxidoreductase subunit 6 (subunit J)
VGAGAVVPGRPSEVTLGHLLLGEYVLPLELAALVILAALLGAVVIVRKETR